MTTISTLLNNLKSLVAKYHYTKTEVDTALDEKLDATDAFSGSYNDLTNKPTSYSATEVVDGTAYANLETSANAPQSAINSAINSKIGSLLSIDLITVVASLPTASVDTMNKMYLVAESDAETNDAYEIFITVEDNGTYAWEKVDSARVDFSEYYTKTQADSTFLAQADFLDTLNDAIEDAIEAEV